jgi:hypothetical protein
MRPNTSSRLDSFHAEVEAESPFLDAERRANIQTREIEEYCRPGLMSVWNRK